MGDDGRNTINKQVGQLWADMPSEEKLVRACVIVHGYKDRKID